jgi:hypothetical protein
MNTAHQLLKYDQITEELDDFQMILIMAFNKERKCYVEQTVFQM